MLASAALLTAILAGEAATPTAPPSDAAPPARESAPRSAQREYDDKRIGFELVPYVSGTKGSVSTTLASVPTLGRYKTPLLGVEFYEVIGREDLASAYRARNIRRGVFMFSGMALMIGGGLWVFTAPSPDVHSSFDEFSRRMSAQDDAARTGAIIAAGGLLVFGVGAFTNPHPVDVAEMRRLADEYNERMRNTLGLSAESGGPADEGDEPRFSFRAAPASGGAVAQIAVSF